MDREEQTDHTLLAHLPALTAWLSARVPELTPPLSTALIPGGRSNLTFAVSDAAGNQFVLRRPPLGALEGNAHDVLREGRIASSLAQTPVPVAPVVGDSDDSSVIGAPFFMMRFVDGEVLACAGQPIAPERGERIAEQLAQTLAAIHEVDLEAAGLTHMQRADSYLARQLRRLRRGLADSGDRFPLLSTVYDLLEEGGNSGLAVAGPSGLLHGDYKLGNVILAPDGAVRAVLDWELSSVGDPLADIGWLVASWADDSDGPWLSTPATMSGGYPSRRDVAQRYAEASGRDLSQLDFYVAFSYWCWSCINVGTRRRCLTGSTAGNVIDIDLLDAQISWQLDRAAQLLRARTSTT